MPKYGVVTAFEDELGQNLDNIKIWGIDVFKISEFSNNKPLTAVTYRVFQVGVLIISTPRQGPGQDYRGKVLSWLDINI